MKLIHHTEKPLPAAFLEAAFSRAHGAGLKPASTKEIVAGATVSPVGPPGVGEV
jgi:hypothetical protein